MDNKAIDLAKYRIDRAKEELANAKLLYKNKSFLAANNRAYYSIFHTIRAIFALERIDFKRHKDAIAYFNQHYVHTEIFPKSMGRRIADANKIREDSDYDYKFIADAEQTQKQIETAEELIKLAEEYVDNMYNQMNND